MHEFYMAGTSIRIPDADRAGVIAEEGLALAFPARRDGRSPTPQAQAFACLDVRRDMRPDGAAKSLLDRISWWMLKPKPIICRSPSFKPPTSP